LPKIIITDLKDLLGARAPGDKAAKLNNFPFKQTLSAMHALGQKSMYPRTRRKVKSLIIPAGLHLVAPSLDLQDMSPNTCKC